MRRYLVVLAAAAALITAACGSSSKSSTNTSQTLQSASPSTTAASAAPSTSTTAAGALVAVASTGLGQTLVDGSGMTLYRFDKDTGPSSNCSGTCASTWPPLTAPSGTTAAPTVAGVTGLTLIARNDGAQQVAHQGHPLYRFSGDTKPGDTNGNGFGGIWHAELAAGSQPAPAAQTTPTTSAYGGYYP